MDAEEFSGRDEELAKAHNLLGRLKWSLALTLQYIQHIESRNSIEDFISEIEQVLPPPPSSGR